MPQTRAEAVATLREGQAQLDALVNELSAADMTTAATIGGGEWSAKDLIAHLQAWERFALDALAQWRKGERPEIEDTFADPERVHQLNASVFEERRRRPIEAVRLEAEQTHGTLISEIERMDDDEWMAKASYPTERRRRLCELLGGVLGAPQRPFGHAFAHLPDLEAYVTSRR